jgi:DNA-binding NtrC family response regulator
MSRRTVETKLLKAPNAKAEVASRGSLACRLMVTDGPDAGRFVPIGAAPILVGSHPDADFRLTDDRVSRRHLSLARQADQFLVKDLGSKNGTLYEGARLSEALVSAGAVFKIGLSCLLIQPESRALDLPPSPARRFGELVAESLAMRQVFALLELASTTDVTVLVEGATGTGKELVARAIHDASPRRQCPFVALDCGALPESLLESELFGHKKGAFTGATSDRLGAFARADRGTLFLDELGRVPPSVPARLLRALEERRIRPVGADAERDVDVRIIAASRDDLTREVADGRFRSDLYYRLSVVRVILPALASRKEDIAAIAGELCRYRGLDPGEVAGPNLARLLAHTWPGNVRELRNVIDRGLALSPNARSFDELRLDITATPADDGGGFEVAMDLPYARAKERIVERFQEGYLTQLHRLTQGNISEAARRSGLDRKHLRGLFRRYGLVGDVE